MAYSRSSAAARRPKKVEVARVSLSDQKVTGLDELRGDDERAVYLRQAPARRSAAFHAKRHSWRR
jgi:hypothetical protein